MALEQFKTQVLLLHSEQSTLDALSAGLADSYAVHLATTGSEALSTLGETPIHVIVSAQDLPGMSGLEALREAKKRSPDTIGILLAGDSRDDGLEALVGDQEVFQIVRGAVTPDALHQLVDQATRRLRLLALGESANDQAANVDEPVSEHIVMETSENGAAIISDGTGRMRALRAQGAEVVSHPGGRDVDLLVLTKDEDFLETIRESSRGLHNVHHACTIAQAETAVAEHRVGVLIADAAMNDSRVEGLSAQLRTASPRLVAIVAGRRDDGEMLMEMINRGHVYRFLLKPVSPGRARLAIEASVKHHMEAADDAFRKRNGEPAADRAADARQVEPSVAAGSSAPDTTTAPPGAGDLLRESSRLRQTMSGLAASAGRSFGRATTTLTVDAGDRRPPPAAANPRAGLRSPLVHAGIVVAAVVIAGGGWWFAASDTVTPDPATVAEPDPRPADAGETGADPAPAVAEVDVPRYRASPDETGTVAAPPPWEALLEQARNARAAGAIIQPPGENALELYIAARDLAPENPTILEEFDTTVDDVFAIVERALLEQRGPDASAALLKVHLAEPAHPRLPFLDAQIARLEWRSRLDDARQALREARLEDAAGALALAGQVAGDDVSEITALEEELALARSTQRIDEVLMLAGQRLAEDALTLPANDNARYYYELALSNDAGNMPARQGLSIVASKLVLRARDAIDNGELVDAERTLQDAGALDPLSTDLQASLQALANARAAADAAAAASAVSVEAPDVAARQDAATRRDGGSPAAPSGAAGDVPVGSASGGTTDEPEPRKLAAALPAARRDAGGAESAGDPPPFVAISSLQRTNYVAPRYPRTAQRRGVTGWVDIGFTVLPDGTVADIDIMDSEPGEIFDASTRDAVAEWHFEPPVEDGITVSRRVAVRLMYDLQ